MRLPEMRKLIEPRDTEDPLSRALGVSPVSRWRSTDGAEPSAMPHGDAQFHPFYGVLLDQVWVE
jgi:hypothetical protein